ncbi:MAG: hypothetical protein KBS59_06655 [Clostridiales bacterium]|nr:hypothetical protein [Clostridiales bacterium]
MKLFKKILCLALAVAMLAAVCLALDSCKEKDKGRLLATYKGGEIYEKDVEDWQNYFLIENLSTVANADDYVAAINDINDSTTAFVAQYKAFRCLLEDEKIFSFTDSDVKAFAERLISEFDVQLEEKGGYGYWKKTYGVSDNFIYDFAEEQLVSAFLEDYVMDHFGVTDELITDYWEKHAIDYLTVPSYKFEVIMVAVADDDKANVTAWDEAKATAERYIARLNAGESFDTVRTDAIANSKNAAASRTYSVSDSVAISSCEGFEDLNQNLAEVAEFIEKLKETSETELVEYADPNGDASEYAFWFQYCNIYNELYVKNSLLNMTIGEVCENPIRHIAGYEIIKLTEIDENIAFLRPENDEAVYKDVYDRLYIELWADGAGTSAQAFASQLAQDYEINIEYSYSAGGDSAAS